MRKSLKIQLIISLIALSSPITVGSLSSQTRQKPASQELSRMEKELRQMQDEYRNSQQSGNPPVHKQQYPQDQLSAPAPIPAELTSTYDNYPSQNRKNWTLEECIQYAIDHNIEIQQLKIQRGVAGIEHSTAKNSRLPNLNAQLSQDWNFGQSQVYTDINKTLGRSIFGISSNIPIFTGFRIPNEIAKTKLDIEAATQNLEKAKDNLSLNITSLFLQVLFNKELVKINEEQYELTQTQVKRTDIMIQGGMVPPSNQYDIQAQLSKDKVSVIESRNALELSLIDLAQALELEKEEQFDITAPGFDDAAMTRFHNSIQPAELIYENAVSFKPSILEQEYRVKSAEKALKIARSEYYPKLDLSFEFGTGYRHIYGMDDYVDPTTQQPVTVNPPFKTQLKDNDYTMVALKLTIPIFNRFQVRNSVRSARLDIMNQQLILKNTKKLLYKEIQTAYTNAVASYEKYTASNDAIKSTSESFRHAQLRYDLAKMTPFEYNEAKSRYIQSQSEQVQAKYDYILRTKILDFYYGIPIKL